MPVATRWHIFCRIVDNYGDAGVCWRLARQLAAEHALDVTLWLDHLAPLARMAPGVRAELPTQRASHVTIRRWIDPFDHREVADVVVEAFGCGVPDRYVDAMARRSMPPAWFVLEYLSAESWVDASHAVGSPHPRLPLARRFWFPGFTPRTGGLLRERGLTDARDRFVDDEARQKAFWASLRVPPPAPHEVRASLFCYPNAALPALLDAWALGDTPVGCIVAEGVAQDSVERWTGGRSPRPGTPFVRGALALHAIPFLAQDDYDRLLWLCDMNFVRGEDSFVRAQWAARPFVWHIYRQADNAHLAKLDAFLGLYLDALDATSASSARAFWRAWNGASGAAAIPHAWRAFRAALPDLRRHGRAWADRLARQRDLASGLAVAAKIWYN